MVRNVDLAPSTTSQSRLGVYHQLSTDLPSRAFPNSLMEFPGIVQSSNQPTTDYQTDSLQDEVSVKRTGVQQTNPPHNIKTAVEISEGIIPTMKGKDIVCDGLMNLGKGLEEDKQGSVTTCIDGQPVSQGNYSSDITKDSCKL